MKRILISLLAGVLIISSACEEVDPDDPINPDDPIVAERPVMRIGSETSTVSDSDSEYIGFENPFEGLSLNSPEKIAMVNIAPPAEGKKKSGQWEEGGIYELYEISQDAFELLEGSAGNNIRFKHLRQLKKINEDWLWMISGGDGMGLTMITDEMEIITSFDITLDSIFDADTIPIVDFTELAYESIGDTLLTNVDTALFNDTVWVQLSYLYTDTLSFTMDTVEYEKEQSFVSILMDLENGKFYEVPKNPHPPMDRMMGAFQVNSVDNSVYFRSGESSQICKLDLSNLTVEIINLPYPAEAQWCVVEEKIFFFNYSQYPKAFCYAPGQGLITKSNIGAEPDVGSIQFVSNSPKIWIRGVQGAIYGTDGICESPGIFSLFELSIVNDSMVFTPVSMNANLTKSEIPEVFGSSIGDYPGMMFNYNGQSWYFNNTDRVAWSYNDVNSEITVFTYKEYDHEVLYNHRSTGSGLVLSLFNNSIYKLDLSVPSLEEFMTISELQIDDFSIGAESNFYISGMRFSDLADVIYEYDIDTGQKIGEWSQENAPPETQIIELVEIF